MRWKTWTVVWKLVASGTCLAIHFGSWIWSLEHTSLEHSLLFVTAHPLVIVFGQYALYAMKFLSSKPSIGELVGSILGFCGLAITFLDVNNGNSKVTAIGDFAAFLGAVSVIGYFVAGRVLRKWMPLFMYAFPVTLLASILLAFAAIFEKGSPPQLIVFGFVTNQSWILYISYIAVFPGIFGHTGINYVLKHLQPLIVSVTLLTEPVLGSFIGFFLKVADIPGLYTFLGTPIIFFGLILVTVSAARRERQLAQQSVEIPKKDEV